MMEPSPLLHSDDDDTTLDLSMVRVILKDALEVVGDLDGRQLEDGTVRNKTAEAQLNRQLLNLADQLQLASSLVRNDYWNGKGLMSYDL